MDQIATMEPKAATGGLTRATKMAASKVNLWYGTKQALFDVSLDIAEREVTALIGPSGCGKSTFLRCLNRMNDTIDGCRVAGRHPPRRPRCLCARRRRGAAAGPGRDGVPETQSFPKSIYDNVAYGPRIHGLARGKADMDEIVEAALRGAGLWDEVADRLTSPATACPAASSSACASRARSRSAPR